MMWYEIKINKNMNNKINKILNINNLFFIVLVNLDYIKR